MTFSMYMPCMVFLFLLDFLFDELIAVVGGLLGSACCSDDGL